MMISFTLIAVLSTTIALVCAQVVLDPTTGRITCPVNAGPTSLAYCAGESLATNIIIRCEGTVGQAGNCNDNLAGIPPVGVKLFAPCYESSPLVGDAACSYDGIVYPDNGSPFRIPSNVTTSTSSLTAIPTSNISTSALGTQTTSNVTGLSTGNFSAVPTSTGLSTGDFSAVPTSTGLSTGNFSAVPGPSVSHPLSLTTSISGVNITILATQTKFSRLMTATTSNSSYVLAPSSSLLQKSSITVATSTGGPYLTNGVIQPGPVRKPIFNHRFKPVPISYGPRETPTTPVVYANDRRNILHNLERKVLLGVFKRDNTTSLQGTAENTAAGTGGPVQTGVSTSPISGASSNIKVAGTWVIGFITLVLTAVMV